AKPISPFGLMGAFSLPGFRKKLQEHYRIPGSDLNEEASLEYDEDRMCMTAFLLDYVIDMGPAGIPTHYQNELVTRRTQTSQDAQSSPPV
ncbi:hypothetical protein FRC07_008378, partial [Ceratobasidium sp. 392]